MKKLKLIFWVTGIVLVIGSGSYFFGFGGTRFTEKLWAIGTAIRFPTIANMKNFTFQGDKMKKLYLFIISGICGWLLSGCVIVSYTEKTDVAEFILEKRFVDKHYLENLKTGNKFILLEDCYIIRKLPDFEWYNLVPVFYIGVPDCLEPRSSLKEWEWSKNELQSFEQKGSGSWFYTPPLTFAINRIKEKLPKGSILKLQGFYRSGRYLDFENGANNYILLQDEKSGKEFYLWALSLDDTYNKRHWIKPYHGEEVK